MTPQQARETAEKIVESAYRKRRENDDIPRRYITDFLVEGISQALTAARADERRKFTEEAGLPVTADGHVITPGMEAWCIRTAKWKWVGERGTPSYRGIEDYADYPEPREATVSHMGAVGSPLQRLGVVLSGMSFQAMTLPEWLYATRDAALAARRKESGE